MLLGLDPEIAESSTDPAAEAVQRRTILCHSKLSQLQIVTPGTPIFYRHREAPGKPGGPAIHMRAKATARVLDDAPRPRLSKTATRH